MKALRVSVPRDQEEAATAALWELGTAGVEVRTAASGRCVLVAYFETAPQARAVSAALPSARVRAVPVPEVDWVARFREGWKGLRAGGFRIVPAWEPSGPGDDVLRVEPGRAFGTGIHETTRLCLAALETLAMSRPLGRVLDVGTGTGLLAVAAARRGARPVVAVDLDPEAIDSTRRHASLNATEVLLLRGDGSAALRPASFDVVLANLTAPLLIERASELAALPGPHGTLVLSGFLVRQRRQVEAAYRNFGPFETRREHEWATLVGRRR